MFFGYRPKWVTNMAGVVLKKEILQARLGRKKMHAAQMQGKNYCTAVRKKKVFTKRKFYLLLMCKIICL